MKHLTLGLLACTLAFIPAQAQNEAPHHAGQTSSTKVVRKSKQRPKAKDNVYYSCPMHPSVRSKSAGRCPKCGMDLRLVRHDEAATEVEVASHDAEAPTSNVQFKETETGRLSKLNIPDLELLDQNGRKIHFYTDLVKGQTVAINFIFTTCTTICPPLGAPFARVQKDLGDKVGRDVRFISISVDPATDTPERLKAWGAKFHAGDGWTFVTGNKPQVDELLRALGASSARREDHTPTILIGNDAHGSWTRTYGLAKASQLVQIINDAIAGKTATTTVETSK
jgi:cytochrome oxidase Cu insertion factor (SCO1/SenC/PrrC family)